MEIAASDLSQPHTPYLLVAYLKRFLVVNQEIVKIICQCIWKVANNGIPFSIVHMYSSICSFFHYFLEANRKEIVQAQGISQLVKVAQKYNPNGTEIISYVFKTFSNILLDG